MLPDRVAKSPEDPSRGAVGVNPVFGMPLHADRKGGRIPHRYGFHSAVLGGRFYLEARTEPIDGLTMDGIDHDFAGAEHVGKAASGLDRNRLADCEALVLTIADGRAVVERAFALLDLGDEGPAQRYVHLLDAPADGQ